MSASGQGDQGGPSESADTTDAPRIRSREGTRRRFLQAAGLSAAGIVAGGFGAAALGSALGASRVREEFTPLAARSEPGFDHVVVVMFENRSFDNVLGNLYTPDTVPSGDTFEGLAFGVHSNTADDGRTVAAHVYSGATDVVMGQPNPDPGEEYPHVNTQLFGVVDPPGNRDLGAEQMSAPFNAPAAGATPTMDGFLRDYESNYRRLKKGEAPTPEEADQIMGGYSPEMLPVFSTLAREFAVFDHWHAAVPSQTFCNRSFFHASTSHGFVTNKGEGGYSKWLAPDLQDPTIFNRLEEAGKTWRIYFDAYQVVSYTGMMHAPVLEKYWRTNFATMEQFYTDVENGTLPDYAFIEPRLVYNHNDMHPPTGRLKTSEVDGEVLVDSAVSDVRAGELLLHEIYSAVRSSATADGSNAMNTLLFVTFDEHGGLYDHVPPPAATPPGDGAAGEMGFTFDRLGCRVPALAISAYTRRNTIVHDEMHHGAVIKTLSRLHGLAPLTKRDDTAKDLYSVVNLETPRQTSDWPTTTPQYLPPNPEASAPHPSHTHEDKPLSPPGVGLMGILLAKYGQVDEPVPDTYVGAYDALQDHGVSLFGTSAPGNSRVE